jgi:hypothetical protein
MNTAILALLGVVSAQTTSVTASSTAATTKISIPQVSWNQTAVDDVVAGLDTYAKQA